MLLPLTRTLERAEIAKQDSDTAYFLHLMYAGELVVKLACAGLIATLSDDTDRHRYRLSHRVVRADGIGEWATTIDELLVGPPAQHVLEEAKTEHRELTQKFDPGAWQYEAVMRLDSCLRMLDKHREGFPFKLEGKRWFQLFTELRNKTRAHGATTSAMCSQLCPELFGAIRLMIDNFSLFKREWVYLHRNLSGKYRVTKISESATSFDILKGSRIPENWRGLSDGIYVFVGGPCNVDLVHSDPDVTDFFFPNGAFTDSKYEEISYVTDTRRNCPSTPFLAPATSLPRSETHGLGRLDLQGSVFGNVPPTASGYVTRDSLERDLFECLMDHRHPIVTLVGRGGIGKTALALAVLHQITSRQRFGAIVWLSARDIDLLPEGPKLAKADILTQRDISKEFVKLMEPREAKSKGFDSVGYFSESLQESPTGFPILFAFDNFETVRNPGELYVFLDTHIRLPNKILITTRSREFKADYPVEVTGMNEDESNELVSVTAEKLQIADILTEDYRRELIRESDGHPYIIKILLGEIANAHKPVRIERIVAGKDRILDALFERTYETLSPAAKQVFLTMCSWRSTIPRVALEAVMLRPANERMDIEEAIDELLRSSFIETVPAEERNESILVVPLAASVFGQRKLRASPMLTTVQANTALLLNFGAAQKSDAKPAVSARIERFFKSVAAKAITDPSEVDSNLPMMEFLAQRFPKGWLLLARLFEELGLPESKEKAKAYLRRFLESAPDVDGGRLAWNELSRLCRITEDWIGEIHALVEVCSLPGTGMKEISNAMNRWNSVFRQQILYLAGDERQILGKRLTQLFEPLQASANATDMSRAAWVYKALREDSKAEAMIREGLRMEPDNEYCLNLAAKCAIQVPLIEGMNDR